MHTFAFAALCALAHWALPTANAQNFNCPVPFFGTPAPFVKNSQSGYDPTTVDWKGFINAVDCLGQREHRACTFIIRMFFHDAGAIDEKFRRADPVNGKYSGADGSVVLNDNEMVLPQSTQHGEAPMSRYTLSKFAARFGMSYADGLSVAAAQCVHTLGSPVNLFTYSYQQGAAIRVGKVDNDAVTIDDVKNPLPGGADSADKWLFFWRQYLNSKIFRPRWLFSVRDAVALMGSHILVDNHGCSRGASGKIRTRNWDNGYFQDTLSGRVDVRPSDSGSGYMISVNGFTESDDSPCDFDTSGFRRKTHNAEHEAKFYQLQNGIFMDDSSHNPNNLDVYWSPDASRAVCFDDELCNSCSSDSSSSFCEDHGPFDAFWPYTVNDGFLAYAARNPAQYCSTAFGGCQFGYDTLGSDLEEIRATWNLFRDNQDAWFTSYAVAHAKLSHLGAIYSDNTPMARGIKLYELIGDYWGQCSIAWSDQVSIVDEILGEPPCDVPDPEEAPGAEPAPEGGCFAGDALVMTPSGEPKRMEDVTVGDHIAVAKAAGSIAFEMVYAQGHADATAISNFVRLEVSPLAEAPTSNGAKTLELTPKHFLPVKSTNGRIYARAEAVKVGDLVWALNAASEMTVHIVTSTSVVTKRGLFNPYTTSGTIIVNSVEVSCHSEWVLDSLLEACDLTHYLPALYQALFAPLRWFLYAVGPSVYLSVRVHDIVMWLLLTVPASGAATLAAAAAVPFVYKAAIARTKA